MEKGGIRRGVQGGRYKEGGTRREEEDIRRKGAMNKNYNTDFLIQI